jgi:hypothetical protein
MAKVTVFKMKRYDMNKDEYVVSSRMATREGAAKFEHVVIEGTGVEIDEAQLEPGEQWTARGFKPD